MDAAPPRALGVAVGVFLLLSGLACVALGVSQLAQASISAALLLWAGLPIAGSVLAALAAYRLFGLLTARYVLNRNGIGVRWGWAVEEIPLPSIRIERPSESLWPQLRPTGKVRWPGCVVGSNVIEGLGPIEFFSTRGPQATLLVISPQRTLAISPRDPEAFQHAFIAASRGPRSVSPFRFGPTFSWRLWRDPARTLLWMGIALPLVLLGFPGSAALAPTPSGLARRWFP
jgi:hypothetical protein